MKILIINGPNLNMLGKRNPRLYGSETLADLESMLIKHADELKIDILCVQSNSEGVLVDFVQQHGWDADGAVVNAAALTTTGYSLLDALLDTKLPFVEVHISNIHAREKFRQGSVFAPSAKGQITGLGLKGYISAIEYLSEYKR